MNNLSKRKAPNDIDNYRNLKRQKIELEEIKKIFFNRLSSFKNNSQEEIEKIMNQLNCNVKTINHFLVQSKELIDADLYSSILIELKSLHLYDKTI